MFACFLFKAILFFFYLLKVVHSSYDAFLFFIPVPHVTHYHVSANLFPNSSEHHIKKSTEADVNYSDSLQKPVFDIFNTRGQKRGGWEVRSGEACEALSHLPKSGAAEKIS